MAKIKNENQQTVISLDEHEHCLLRPTMWIGSVEPSSENVPIIINGELTQQNKKISVGFYKLMNEILDNAFDEAKRLKGQMPKIKIEFNSFTSEVTVTDTGIGFFKGTAINKKTGLNNIETAMSGLRAGTNFFNKNSEDALIGTNGVGASLVNMLSSKFTIETVNETHYFFKSWNNFIPNEKITRKRKRGEALGTKISFIPRDEAHVHAEHIKLFMSCVWDKDYIHTQMILRNFLKKEDPIIENLDFSVYFDNVKLDLNTNFLPEKTVTIKNKYGMFIFWKKYDNSTSLSFMNGTQCTGIHQKIFQDWINDLFGDNLAHHFYDTLILLNLPPKFVRFADQNKTKYAGGRWEIEDLLKRAFYNKIKINVKKSPLFKDIMKRIEDRMFADAMGTIKRKKKQNKQQKVSDKYIPPASRKDTIFLTEGNSARSALLQRRNSDSDGVYTLRGKIKNAKHINDLSKNIEIIDIMTILDISPNDCNKCTYSKIVIATDADSDGIGHIASLLINLFYKWFPDIINSGKLYILITPLVSIEIKGEVLYFYSLKEYNEFLETNTEKIQNLRYLKGLGSLELTDWEFVMKQRRMFQIYNDRSAKRYMDMAFGTSSNARKQWLQS